MRFVYLCTLLGAVLLSGCAGNPMQTVSNPTVQPSAADQAQVVFMRSANTGKLNGASVYDVTQGQTRFVGILNNETKIAYPTTPGKHTFMVVSEAADFMDAELVAGKTYYALVTPRMGLWKARFSLWPVGRQADAPYSQQSSDFKDWVADTDLVTNSPKSLAWFEQNKADIEDKRHEYWPVWQKKSAADLAKRTLKADDGQ